MPDEVLFDYFFATLKLSESSDEKILSNFLLLRYLKNIL